MCNSKGYLALKKKKKCSPIYGFVTTWFLLRLKIRNSTISSILRGKIREYILIDVKHILNVTVIGDNGSGYCLAVGVIRYEREHNIQRRLHQ